MDSGATIRCFVEVIGIDVPLTLYLGASGEAEEASRKAEEEPGKADGSASPINRAVGPLKLQRAKLKYHSATKSVAIDFDAEIGIMALGVVLQDLSFSIPLPEVDDAKTWVPNLAGIGIGGGVGEALRFDGALHAASLNPIDLSGGLLVGVAKQIGVSVMAGFKEFEGGKPSFFGYGFVKIPVELPPPFAIEGVSLGFAYNRDLVIPAVEDLATFPFIAAAMSFSDSTGNTKNPLPADPSGPSSLVDAVTALGTVAPAKDGAYWFTAGLAFSLAGRILKGFALLSVEAGSATRIAATGELRVSVPPTAQFGAKAPKALYIDAFLDIVIDVTEGLIALDAYINSASFVVEKKATLTGALALRIWTAGAHRGQFVLSVGGYAPELNLAAFPHYPTVPRLRMNLQLSDMVQVQGETYFALTSALVAYGMNFQCNAKFGPVRVWANVHFDALITWDPFHYDLEVGLEFGAQLRVKVWFVQTSVTVHVGAGLHMWGPTFSGKAWLDFSVVKVSFHLGGHADPTPTPISWKDFKTRYLPAAPSRDISGEPPDTVQPADGVTPAVVGVEATADQMIRLKRESVDDIAWVVDPETTRITTRTAIPANAYDATCLGKSTGQNWSDSVAIGVLPCGIPTGLPMRHVVTLTAVEPGTNATFKITPTRENVPAALWGAFTPDVNNPDAAVNGAVVGLVIEPIHPAPDVTRPTDADNLLFANDVLHLGAPGVSTDHGRAFANDTVSDTIGSRRAAANREALFGAFAGVLPGAELPDVTIRDVDISGFAGGNDNDLFIQPPRLQLLGENRA
ncbi:hypothetical protein MCW82_27980 [Azospirillum doebereinerae]|nr:DUF6603 domain-containing protein [Azospirillum doebereinerae]MCG5243624.1 hypothetical protein [Azospirillum doebereinerae]